MTRARFVVLYEDSRGPSGEFAFHRLVTRCVLDQTGAPELDVRRRLGDGVPLNGVGNVLERCRTDAERMSNAGFVFAVLDNDAVRSHLSLGKGATKDEVLREIHRRAGAGASTVHYCLLEQNLESLIAALVDCGLPIERDTRSRAIEGKERDVRDRVFRLAADGENRRVRDCVMERNPSFAALITALVERW